MGDIYVKKEQCDASVAGVTCQGGPFVYNKSLFTSTPPSIEIFLAEKGFMHESFLRFLRVGVCSLLLRPEMRLVLSPRLIDLYHDAAILVLLHSNSL